MEYSSSQDPAEFYKNLEAKLAETSEWPSSYMYKFIVPTKEGTIQDITAIFDNMGAVITTKESKNKKYTSVSIQVRMPSPGMVITKYKEVGQKVKNVISL